MPSHVQRLRERNFVSTQREEPTPPALLPDANKVPLTILYRDEAIVAIDKPAGLLVHRSRIDTRATEFAVQKLRDQIGQPVFLVHRIDRPTSGVLLFALNPETARSLCEQFQNRTTLKTYSAIVRGRPPAQGVHDEPLIEKRDAVSDQQADENKPPQPAITEFRTMQSWTVPYSTGTYPVSWYSQVDITPKTGRRHQIRRHFNHMAFPLIGDTTHGDRRHNRLFRDVFGIRRLLLVARTLELTHPKTGQPVCIRAELGAEFELAIKKLNAADQE